MTEKPSLWWSPATEIHMNCQFYPKKNRNNNNSNNNNNYYNYYNNNNYYYYYYYHYYDCYYISYPPFPWNPLYPAQKQSFFFDTFIKILISVKSNRIQLWCSSMSIITLFRRKDFPDLADLVDFFLYFTQCGLETGEWFMCLFWFNPQSSHWTIQAVSWSKIALGKPLFSGINLRLRSLHTV